MDMEIRELRSGEEGAVSDLVLRTFHTFVGHEYSPAGVATFTSFACPEAIWERAKTQHLTLVALVEGELVGMIQLRSARHLSLLFVAEAFHGRGVARRLLATGLERILAQNPGLLTLTVNSSRFAVPIYERLGFKVTEPERTLNGVTFVPMALDINTAAPIRANPAGKVR
jgi:GNAT superfamily N-acetyltransferase